MNASKLDQMLSLIGENESLRSDFIEWCKSVEQKLEYTGNVRDDITKHLVDAIYAGVPLEKKKIKNGLTFEFIPNVHSKVAREFIMSIPSLPDHVWEPQTTKLLSFLAKNAKNVIIGGAYFGDQAIIIGSLIKDNKGTVHAFELNKKQAEILKRNASINHLNNVNVINKGLWNNDNTFLELSDTDDLAFSTPQKTDIKKISNAISIDTYLSNQNIDKVDLIMLDIEGAEYNVLQGSIKHLKLPKGQAPNIVFEIHRHYADWSNGLEKTDIVKLLESFGYTMFSIRDFQANYDLKDKPIELIAPSETYLEGPPHGFNILAIKDTDIINNENFRICSGVSPKYLTHKDPKIHHPVDGLGL